jgi:hypothetical protein
MELILTGQQLRLLAVGQQIEEKLARFGGDVRKLNLHESTTLLDAIALREELDLYLETGYDFEYHPI